MKNVMRLAIVDPIDSSRNVIKNQLLGLDMVWLEAECSRYEFFSDVVNQTRPDIALVSLDANPTNALALISQIAYEMPTCSVLVVSSSQEGSLILQAVRNGAKEFLSYPIQLEDFVAALNRIKKLQSTNTGEREVRSSQVVSIAGVTGGVGCTSLAINLACILAKNQENAVTTIDLDLALGDADVWLDIIPDYTIQDVAENINRLDFAMLKRSLTQHECGAFLLPRPVHLEEATLITPDELRRVIALLKATFTHLILDVSKNYGPLDLAAMEASDIILLVTQLDLPSLRNVVRLLQYFEFHDGLTEKVKIVVNRAGREDSQISVSKALDTIGRDIFAKIPNDYATLIESRNNGIPLIIDAPKSKATKAFEQLALLLNEVSSEDDQEQSDSTEKPKSRKGIFSFLGSKASQ